MRVGPRLSATVRVAEFVRQMFETVQSAVERSLRKASPPTRILTARSLETSPIHAEVTP